MNLKAFLLSSAVTIALCVCVCPAHGAKKHHAAHAAGPSYPMKSDKYRKLFDKRLERLWAAIEKKLDHRSVSADRKKAMRKMFDEAAEETRTEANKATADGVVTQAEGDKVKRLAQGIRLKLRERLKAEKAPKGAPPNPHEAAKNAHAKPRSPGEKTAKRNAPQADEKRTEDDSDHPSASRRGEPTRKR